MKIHPHSMLLSTSLLLLVLMLLISACGTGGSDNTKTTTATKTVETKSAAPKAKQTLPNGPIVYVALGASDAVGVGANQPGSQGYVPLIAGHLPAGSHLVNLGISGIHLHEALSRELPLAISTSPQLVTIWLVANDFVAGVSYNSYMQDLKTLLQQLQAGTKAKVVMANLPDLTLLPAFARDTAAQKTQMRNELQRWNNSMATIAAQYNVTIVDLFGKESELTAHPEYVSADGFHPSPAGYRQLATLFWNTIQEG